MKILLTALALLCIIEALPWLINPQKMKDALEELGKFPNESIRNLALGIFSVGCILLWLTLRSQV